MVIFSGTHFCTPGGLLWARLFHWFVMDFKLLGRLYSWDIDSRRGLADDPT